MSFQPCPRIDVAAGVTSIDFWEEFGANPRPLIIAGGIEHDFWSEYGHAEPNGGRVFQDMGRISQDGRGTPYMLTNPGYTPKIFRDLPTRFPIPDILSDINQRPVLSIGLKGTGERDIAHHYHPITAMRLLQGEKIWALRPQGDAECMSNTGSCTDPMNICEYYARASSPAPTCVQRAGDTIIVPDGWYHGTCNNASVTVGWGAQGRSLPLRPPACFHCNSRTAGGQFLYASTGAQPLLAQSNARDLEAQISGDALWYLPRPRDGFGGDLMYLGPSAQTAYMAFRSRALPQPTPLSIPPGTFARMQPILQHPAPRARVMHNAPDARA